jgi:steroid delta-isomerase-like uncharacterized protein
MATEQTQDTQIREVTERWMQAWTGKDADGLVACIADDLHYTDPAWPDVMRSADDVRAFTSAVWRAMPDVQFSEPIGLTISPDGTSACAPWRMTATLTGKFDPPGYAPTGDRIEVDGVDVFTVRDGKITRLQTVYDTMEIGRTIGLLPARGSRAEQAAVRLQALLAKRRRR